MMSGRVHCDFSKLFFLRRSQHVSDSQPDNSFSTGFGWQVLCEDGPVLAINKPAGLLTLGAHDPAVPTLEKQVRNYLKSKYHKPGNVYLGIPHRLDRPVSGVILFARNSKAAGRLAEQFRERQVRKTYWGITTSEPDQPTGTLTNWLLKETDKAHVHVVTDDMPGARQAILHYRVVAPTPLGTLLEIELETGRMHQIRVQLAARGWPIVGDTQYGATRLLVSPAPDDPTLNPIALHARQLTFLHPVRYDSMTVVAPLPQNWGDLQLEVPELMTRKRNSPPPITEADDE
jgi:23S rRNA pseudouridine1911/1915/1917 synthase